MTKGQYPAWDKRVALLRRAHDWIIHRDALNDYSAILDKDQVERWAVDIEGMSKTGAVYLLTQLVNEGYITLVRTSREISPEPFVYIVPQSLTEKGLLAIGEMPDPQERLALILEATVRAVQKNETLDEDEKKKWIDWFEELKIFFSEAEEE